MGSPLPFGTVKLNSDGAMDKHGNAAAGGLLRDHSGNLLVGYQRHIGTCSSLAAELWGLRDGLKLAKDFDYQCVQISLDSVSVINLIRNHDI